MKKLQAFLSRFFCRHSDVIDTEVGYTCKNCGRHFDLYGAIYAGQGWHD